MTDHATEAEAVAAIARQSTSVEAVSPDTLYLVRRANSHELIDLERFASTPYRKRGHVTVHDAASFLAYHSRHSTSKTEVFADHEAPRIVAVIDSHAGAEDEPTAGEPGWGHHRVTLAVHKTDAWSEWRQRSGKLLGQVEFAEFVEQRLPDFISPEGATMLEIAQSFHATKKGRFESSRRLADGQTQLEFREETTASAGKKGSLDIPTVFELGIAPYEGSKPYKVTARLRYRIGDEGDLRIGYVLDRPSDIERAAFVDIVDEVAAGIDPDEVFRGTPQS